MLLALAKIGLGADKHIPWSGRACVGWAVCWLLGPWVLSCVAATWAAEAAKAADLDVGRLYHSHHVRLHTDLDPVRARQCLQRIERVLTLASKYWGRPLPGEIDAYVVDQLDRWPAAAFPLPQASLVLKHIGGGTACEQPADHSHRALQTCIYATTQSGVVEHEAVHAYCFQTFGRGGPTWYQEGMAEVLAAASRPGSWTCRPETRQLLRSAESVSVAQILGRTDFTRELGESVQQANAGPNGVGPRVAFDLTRWTPRDQQVLRQTRQAYAESWALCHLLSRNANYRAAFRQLGRRVLDGDTQGGQEKLAAVAPRIDFELEQFRRHLEDGYQADLCRWPWEATFALLGVDESTSVRVPARNGFQATGVLVAPGQTYTLQSTGQWTLKPGDAPVNGADNADGWGDLEACVMHGFCLSPPVRLTGNGVYTPTQAGKLFVRCRDRWHLLSDNHGELQLRLLRVR